MTSPFRDQNFLEIKGGLEGREITDEFFPPEVALDQQPDSIQWKRAMVMLYLNAHNVKLYMMIFF